MRISLLLWFGLITISLAGQTDPFLLVLGTAQDAGFPHAGCGRECCRDAWGDPALREPVSCLGVVDPRSGKTWLFDATPDLPLQMHRLQETAGNGRRVPDGIFLTHAHIGHYSGLMYLGREGLGADSVAVFALPRMRSFLESNGPWSQLVGLGQIALNALKDDTPVDLSPDLRVTPVRVPHRDEFSETVGYRIDGPTRRVLFIPDIDKWSRWDRDLATELQKVDLAFLDATFFDGNELRGRSMADIPHPFVVETLDRLAALPASERAKVHFIHMNHTNPILDRNSPASGKVRDAGFGIARTGDRFGL